MVREDVSVVSGVPETIQVPSERQSEIDTPSELPEGLQRISYLQVTQKCVIKRITWRNQSVMLA